MNRQREAAGVGASAAGQSSGAGCIAQNEYNTAKMARQPKHGRVSAGVKREDARFILPEATATKMMMTANFREWRHVIRLRCDKAAQWEIRAVAMEALRQLHGVAPSCFADLWGQYGRA